MKSDYYGPAVEKGGEEEEMKMHRRGKRKGKRGGKRRGRRKGGR